MGSAEQVLGKLYADQVEKLGGEHPTYESHVQTVRLRITPTVTETVSDVGCRNIK